MGTGVSFLDADEYVNLNYPRGRVIEHGPGASFYACASATKKKFPVLTQEEYLEVTHLSPDQNGGNVLEIIAGPTLYKPTDAYAKISDKKQKVRLAADQYVTVKDVDGNIRIVAGPTLYCPRPYESISSNKSKINLAANEYIFVTTVQTGQIRMEVGPQLYTPQPLEEVSNIKPKTVLKNNEYVKIIDTNSGVIRVVKGPATIIPTQFEQLYGTIEKMHEVNDMNAVYIFDTSTGEYSLITEHGMFVPSPVQNVIEPRDKIRLQLNECMVIVDKNGKYTFMKGNDNTSAFFLPPYCKVLEEDWSTDGGKSVKKISRFDLRPQYMDFEFLIRTKDNVEIFLKLNFYWKIVNVELMVSTTHNAPQDVCLHAQSEILSEISRVDMKEFMESFNMIVHKAISEKDDFYSKRGVELMRVEITGRRCKDQNTEQNFQEIIQRKTDRIKNLEKQHGDNEVKLSEIQGHIEQEKLVGELVGVKNSYLRNEQSKMGEAAGSKISLFMEQLPESLTTEQKLDIYYDQQNTQRVESVTKISNLTLYLSQKDLDIKMVNLNYGDKKVDPLLLEKM
jgi:regulator of protease activity HflC (stomatin/prohibitin superfamily)